MSLTSDMKDELARSAVTSQSAMAAEVCAILRFSGGLHLVGGRILIEAELDSSVARFPLNPVQRRVLRRCGFGFIIAAGQALRGSGRASGG